MPKLFWCPNTRAFRGLWLLEEAGIPYERVQIDIADPKSRANPEFIATSPQGKVPALLDGPVRISDSGAMCIYIADAYPRAGLGPVVGHPDRGAFLQWTLFNNSNLEPSMAEKVSGLPPNHRQHGWGDYESTMRALRKGLESGPFILGEKFSAADVMLGSGLNFMFMFKMLDGAAEPLLKAYTDRCMARPAAQTAAQLSIKPS
jgi:glutathione S-transferase